MRIVSVLVSMTVLFACEGQPREVATVRAAGDTMEESGSFAVRMTVDLKMPKPLTSVETAIQGKVDLSTGQSTFHAQSSDEDAWTELAVGGLAYHSGGEIVNAPDWCAVPISSLDGNALIQTGPLFGQVPELLRSASDASAEAEESTDLSTAYRVTFPLEGTASAARVLDNQATIWLDQGGRPVRAEFAFTQPVAGSTDEAIGHVVWRLTGWGEVDVDVTPPSDDEVQRFPDCVD
jgi:hypothetical protein